MDRKQGSRFDEARDEAHTAMYRISPMSMIGIFINRFKDICFRC
ncbi:hypothetical protein PO124_04625 [Bacillus licheniformis]|nr:hypothetical protein [Bacillus licheniformis]